MDSLDFVQSSIVEYLPDEVDYSRPLALTNEVLRREYVEILPPNSKVGTISGSSLSNVVEIKLSDSGRWLDTDTATVSFSVGNIVLNAPSGGTTPTNCANFICLDGPTACITRVAVSVGGVNLGNINDFNKHSTAKWINNALADNVASDALTLNGGLLKWVSLADPSNPPTSANWYGSLGSSPKSFTSTAVPNAKCQDGLGFLTPIQVNTPFTKQGCSYYNSFEKDQTSQRITIKLGDLCPFFKQARYLPLFLMKDVIIQIFFAPPQTAFCTDLCSIDTSGAGTFKSLNTISAYDVSSIKLSCDLVTCSDSLNNAYKMRALSEEGIMLPFDDVAVQQTKYSYSGTSRQMQCNLSTNNLKSILFYLQSSTVSSSQNCWSNSNFNYYGIQNFQLNINNNNQPANPLMSINDIQGYNLRSKGVVGNSLSNQLAQNYWIAYGAECSPNSDAVTVDDINAGAVSFMIYANLEKVINENPNIISNGVNLRDASSTITIKYSENSDATGGTVWGRKLTMLGSDYNAYCQMTYQRALVLKNGVVEIMG